MNPEEAQRAARERAAGRPAVDGALDETFEFEAPTIERLSELAVIEVDHTTLYSTRRGGAPVTWLKRLLLRLMRQYFVEAEARQTRFNLAVVAKLRELEKK